MNSVNRDHVLPPTGEGEASGTLCVTTHNRLDISRTTITVSLPLLHAIKGGHPHLPSAKERVEIVETDDHLKIMFTNQAELTTLLGDHLNRILGELASKAHVVLCTNEEYSTVTACHYLTPEGAQELLTAFVVFSYGFTPTEDMRAKRRGRP